MFSRKAAGIFLTILGALISIIHLLFLKPDFMYLRWIGFVLFVIIGPLMIPNYEQKKTTSENQ